jgi:hypothetical protein
MIMIPEEMTPEERGAAYRAEQLRQRRGVRQMWTALAVMLGIFLVAAGLYNGHVGLDLVEFLVIKIGGIGVFIIAFFGIGIGLIVGMTVISYACAGACDGVEKLFRGDF